MPKGVYIRTEVHNKNRSIRMSGKKRNPCTEEHKRKISQFMKGNKYGLRNKGKKKPPLTEETKRKIAESMKGKNLGTFRTKEQKEKLSLLYRGKSNLFLKGKTFEEIHGIEKSKQLKKNLSEANKGDKHPNWNGGSSFEPYGFEFTFELKLKIKVRDNFRCRICNLEEKGNQQSFHIHHIDYNKKNNISENLVTLCRSCHIRTNYNRDSWKEYFHNKFQSKFL